MTDGDGNTQAVPVTRLHDWPDSFTQTAGAALRLMMVARKWHLSVSRLQVFFAVAQTQGERAEYYFSQGGKSATVVRRDLARLAAPVTRPASQARAALLQRVTEPGERGYRYYVSQAGARLMQACDLAMARLPESSGRAPLSPG